PRATGDEAGLAPALLSLPATSVAGQLGWVLVGCAADKSARATGDEAGLALLKRRRVEFNILTTVHAADASHPLRVYRFLRDEAGAQFIQFIPIVERRVSDDAQAQCYVQAGDQVTARSVTARQWGDFLIGVFDEWARRDVGRMYVQHFDVALAMEHNGNLFACDHFVEPAYRLGNIIRDTLPRYCRECAVRFVCNGGCPKDRFIAVPDGEPGLNYLCAGYKAFFTHIDAPMRFMAAELKARRAPANVMAHLRQRDLELRRLFARAGRNDPCPCGSGKKFKACHGR
ncbi:MAG: SEC-C metal-binding domain-containing protein, partial [Candidatus Roseilinea sp.]|uniref:SEC-C metal-binding domain-containing protein n=1 Tax=Candidatus Roseilinea sp. TaxID=2838777 RepID=UPI00404AC8A7